MELRGKESLESAKWMLYDAILACGGEATMEGAKLMRAARYLQEQINEIHKLEHESWQS